MPLWLRKFVYGKIKQHYDKQAEKVKQAKQNPNTQSLTNPDGTVKSPTKSSYK